MIFTATQNTMYWVWDFSLMSDGARFTYDISNIVLKPVIPTFGFGTIGIKKDTGSTAKGTIVSYDKYSISYNYVGDAGYESIYFKIEGLVAGTTYTFYFDHTFSGKYNKYDGSFEYGCVINNNSPGTGAKLNEIINDRLDTTAHRFDGENQTVKDCKVIFTAKDNTAYWSWNMANVRDGVTSSITITVTRFSASHNNGGTINYYAV